MLDVAGGGRGWTAHEPAHLGEEAGEELRDLYVALTRAQSQVVTWWAPTANTPTAGCTGCCSGASPAQARGARRASVVKDDDYVAAVLGLLDELGGAVARGLGGRGRGAPAARGRRRPTSPRARFDREVDTEWRRTSYSGLIRAAGAAGRGVDSPSPRSTAPTDEEPRADEPRRGRRSAADAGEPAATCPRRWPTCPSGATFGTPGARGARARRPRGARPRAPSCARARRGAAAAGGRSASTPTSSPTALLPLAAHPARRRSPAGCTLVDIPLRDRLCELDFEFPLAGGDRPDGATPTCTSRDVGAAAAPRTCPPTTRCAPTPTGSSRPALGEQALRGYLSGSIDVVLRVPGDGRTAAPLRRRRLQDQPARRARRRR